MCDCANKGGCVKPDVQQVVTDGLSRRTFLLQSALAAAAAALAACGGSSTAPPISGFTVKVSDYPALSNVGGVATLTISGTPVAIARTGTSSFVAVSRVCTHQGVTVDPVSGGYHCSGHGATFDLTGRWTGGQQTSNLNSYATTYNAGAGTITIG